MFVVGALEMALQSLEFLRGDSRILRLGQQFSLSAFDNQCPLRLIALALQQLPFALIAVVPLPLPAIAQRDAASMQRLQLLHFVAAAFAPAAAEIGHGDLAPFDMASALMQIGLEASRLFAHNRFTRL